ncbi:MAG: rhodanese-like domain-containing protein, partial [Deltaproteobacteria bacterium]|nr:rhodanese-like domain-containing protein [Deltaproteobacteria bacterium]
KRREQEVSMLPGAITSEEFEGNMEKYQDKTIVVYCTIGNRSGHYTKHLIEKGIRAYNLRGSILAWIHAGQRLVSDGEETRRVHVYGRKWNLAPKEYEAVW